MCNFVNLFKIHCPGFQLSSNVNYQIVSWTSFFIIHHSLPSTCCTPPRDMHWFLHWTSFFIIHHTLLSTCCTSPRDMHWFLRWDTFSLRFGLEPILLQRIKVTPQPLIQLFSKISTTQKLLSSNINQVFTFKIFPNICRSENHASKQIPPAYTYIHKQK